MAFQHFVGISALGYRATLKALPHVTHTSELEPKQGALEEDAGPVWTWRDTLTTESNLTVVWFFKKLTCMKDNPVI